MSDPLPGLDWSDWYLDEMLYCSGCWLADTQWTNLLLSYSDWSSVFFFWYDQVMGPTVQMEGKHFRESSQRVLLTRFQSERHFAQQVMYVN